MKKDYKKKMKIEKLEKSEKDKNLLKELGTPKTIAEVAAILGCSYNYASTKLMVFVAEGIVKKNTFGKRKKYFLNQDEVEL